MIRGVVGLAALAAPLVLLQTASQAAPTLTIEQAQAQLADLQKQQDHAVEALNQGQIVLDAAQADADAAKASIDRQQAKVNEAAAQLSTLARAAYMSGGIDPVTGLLSGQGASTVVERVGSLDQIARVRAAQSTELKSQETALASLELTSKQKLAAAQAAAKDLSDAKSQVDKLVEQQNNVLNNLQAEARKALEAKQAADRAAAQAAAAKAIQPASFTGPAGSYASTVVSMALSQRGKPYVYAGSGPNAYDCSGLTMWAFAQAGISLPHSSQAQFNMGRRIARADLQPGDLVFFESDLGHVGIYYGNGMMIDANHTGGWVDVRPLYAGYQGAVRI